MKQRFRSNLELHGAIGRMILTNAADVCVKEDLNGQYYVSFSYPRLPGDNERYDAIIEDNEVRFPTSIERGQHFVIKSVQEERKGLRVYKRVEAHHVSAELARYYLDDYVDFEAARPPSFLLAKLGNNTPFTFAVEGAFEPADVFNFGEKRKHELLAEVRALYGAETTVDNYNITLTTRAGANRGMDIRYRKNLSGITRKSHSMERVTRLYGYGKNGLTIEGHAGHVAKHIDSPYLDLDRPFEGRVDFPDIEEAGALLAAMQRHLREVELPKVSYEIDFVELEKADAEFSPIGIRGVGDTITVIDEMMGYRFDARVTSYERYPFEPKRGRVVLANFRELTEANFIYRATVASRKAMVYTSENAVLKGVKYDDSITIVDGVGITVADDFGRIRVQLGQWEAGNYGIVTFNKAGGKTFWLDGNTGDARFAGMLEAAGGTFRGTLNGVDGTFTGTMQAGAFVGGSITGSNMSATNIEGGTITGAMVQTGPAGSFPRAAMSNTSQMFGVYSSADAGIEMRSFGGAGATSSMRFFGGGSGATIGYASAAAGLYMNGPKMTVEMTELFLRGYSGTNVLSWANLRSEATGQTLQGALDAKATKGEATSNAGGFNGGIPIGTKLAVDGGGYVIWTGVPAHSHIT